MILAGKRYLDVIICEFFSQILPNFLNFVTKVKLMNLL